MRPVQLLTTHRSDHRRIEVEELHGSGGASTFTSINGGSLIAKVRTGTHTHHEETFTTYDRDLNAIFCVLEVEFLHTPLGKHFANLLTV